MIDYNVVFVGAPSVGKTALTTRLLNHLFCSEYYPTIEDVYEKEFVVDGEPCVLHIVDTGGEEKVRMNIGPCLELGDGFLLVFAANNVQSFEDINVYREQIRNAKGSEKVPMVLVGNKCDLPWTVDKNSVTELVETLAIPFVETSAKLGYMCIIDAVCTLVREIRKDKKLRAKEKSKGNKKNKRKRCVLL